MFQISLFVWFHRAWEGWSWRATYETVFAFYAIPDSDFCAFKDIASVWYCFHCQVSQGVSGKFFWLGCGVCDSHWFFLFVEIVFVFLFVLQDKKISRHEMIQKVRKVAGDKLLFSVIKSFRAKVLLISLWWFWILFFVKNLDMLVFHFGITYRSKLIMLNKILGKFIPLS